VILDQILDQKPCEIGLQQLAGLSGLECDKMVGPGAFLHVVHTFSLQPRCSA